MTDQTYHASGVGASGALQGLIRELIPHAVWDVVKELIVLMLATSIGIIFRHWVAAHLSELAIIAAVFLLFAVALVLRSAGAIRRIVDREAKRIEQEANAHIATIQQEHVKELETQRTDLTGRLETAAAAQLHSQRLDCDISLEKQRIAALARLEAFRAEADTREKTLAGALDVTSKREKAVVAELDDVYADVILCWLKLNVKGKGFFDSETLRQYLRLDLDKVERGLRFLLQKHELVEHTDGQWKFDPEAAIVLTPYFCRNPALQTTPSPWW